MGKAKKTRKFAVAKRIMSPKDTRVKENMEKAKQKDEAKKKKAEPKQLEQANTALFFQYNTQLGPPYHVLVDTNFINFSIRYVLEVVTTLFHSSLSHVHLFKFRKKLDMIRAMMDCLLAKCTPCITDCVMGELEKLGGKYKIALRLAKDPRFERIPCSCKGCYADDCLTNMAKQWRCFIVATCDKELRGRIRKIPGVPCMYISGYKYTVEVSWHIVFGFARRIPFLFHFANFVLLYSECRKRLALHPSWVALTVETDLISDEQVIEGRVVDLREEQVI